MVHHWFGEQQQHHCCCCCCWHTFTIEQTYCKVIDCVSVCFIDRKISHIVIWKEKADYDEPVNNLKLVVNLRIIRYFIWFLVQVDCDYSSLFVFIYTRLIEDAIQLRVIPMWGALIRNRQKLFEQTKHLLSLSLSLSLFLYCKVAHWVSIL